MTKEIQTVDQCQQLEFGKMTDRMAAKAASAETIEAVEDGVEIDDGGCWARTADRHLVAVDVDQWTASAPELAQRSQDRLRLMAELAELMREAWDEVGLDLINATNALSHMASRHAWRKAAGLHALDKEDATAARKWSRERHAVEPAMVLGITKVSPRNIMAGYARIRGKGETKPSSWRKFGDREVIPHGYDTDEVARALQPEIDTMMQAVAKASTPPTGHRVPDEALQVAMLEAMLMQAQEKLRLASLWQDDGTGEESTFSRKAKQWQERQSK